MDSRNIKTQILKTEIDMKKFIYIYIYIYIYRERERERERDTYVNIVESNHIIRD